MPVILGAQGKLVVGQKTQIDSKSPSVQYAVVFEDDGDTGYFYALDFADKDNPIQDALHIYNAMNVTDGHISSELSIIWSQDGMKSALLINDYPHAIFDFVAKRGYCRTDFPPPFSKWPQPSHAWNDDVLNLFK